MAMKIFHLHTISKDTWSFFTAGARLPHLMLSSSRETMEHPRQGPLQIRLPRVQLGQETLGRTRSRLARIRRVLMCGVVSCFRMSCRTDRYDGLAQINTLLAACFSSYLFSSHTFQPTPCDQATILNILHEDYKLSRLLSVLTYSILRTA